MAIWIRQDVDIHDHPDLIDAAAEVGGWALVAWQTILRLVKAHGKNGTIDRKWITGAKLAHYSLWGPTDAPPLDRARDALVAHGLLRVEGETFSVPGWSSYQIDPRPPGRERRPMSQGQEQLSQGQPPLSQSVPSGNRDTQGTGRYGTGRDVTERKEDPPIAPQGADSQEGEKSPTPAGLPWPAMLDAYNAAAARAPAGIAKSRKWDNQLQRQARQRLDGEADPLALWQQACSYLPDDDHYSGRNRDSREPQFRAWKVTLGFLCSPSGWRKVTEKAETRRAEQAEQGRVLREIEAERQRQAQFPAATPAQIGAVVDLQQRLAAGIAKVKAPWCGGDR